MKGTIVEMGVSELFLNASSTLFKYFVI